MGDPSSKSSVFQEIFSLEKKITKSYQRFQNFSLTDVSNQLHLAAIRLLTLPLLPSSGHMFYTICMTSFMTSLFFTSLSSLTLPYNHLVKFGHVLFNISSVTAMYPISVNLQHETY